MSSESITADYFINYNSILLSDQQVHIVDSWAAMLHTGGEVWLVLRWFKWLSTVAGVCTVTYHSLW